MSQTYIITGVSSGLGFELAKQLINEGSRVIGLSRSDSEELRQWAKERGGIYTYYPVDLSDPDQLDSIMETVMNALAAEVSAGIEAESGGDILLVNNAAAVKPLNVIELCEPEEITASIHLNIMAPVKLAARFIGLTHGWNGRRKIINISSGSAKYPAPGMSVYCCSKSALNMFSQCVAAEQEGEEDPVQIMVVDPGMMDTSLQEEARRSNTPVTPYFIQAKEQGALADPGTAADKLLAAIRYAEPAAYTEISL
ncbi:SDR family NAD(P)-dependent oxidoreductase [Paenibacillus tarimensis]|uniref:SDR family NAD(P)-dependent oxidoreductase n=1 Tax=Paenibacillus tarimensis TaxID=416012 RepID=UPI001F28C5F9|nr:SDR family NAD(P)-dependent oxidoreductase [Paenibacillus tarimensis]MCF2943034.1 SDR family NAD(P)-dependent oxidoreductase [Paenibacillus tarimensis]